MNLNLRKRDTPPHAPFFGLESGFPFNLPDATTPLSAPAASQVASFAPAARASNSSRSPSRGRSRRSSRGITPDVLAGASHMTPAQPAQPAPPSSGDGPSKPTSPALSTLFPPPTDAHAPNHSLGLSTWPFASSTRPRSRSRSIGALSTRWASAIDDLARSRSRRRGTSRRKEHGDLLEDDEPDENTDDPARYLQMMSASLPAATALAFGQFPGFDEGFKAPDTRPYDDSGDDDSSDGERERRKRQERIKAEFRRAVVKDAMEVNDVGVLSPTDDAKGQRTRPASPVSSATPTAGQGHLSLDVDQTINLLNLDEGSHPPSTGMDLSMFDNLAPFASFGPPESSTASREAVAYGAPPRLLASVPGANPDDFAEAPINHDPDWDFLPRLVRKTSFDHSLYAATSPMPPPAVPTPLSASDQASPIASPVASTGYHHARAQSYALGKLNSFPGSADSGSDTRTSGTRKRSRGAMDMDLDEDLTSSQIRINKAARPLRHLPVTVDQRIAAGLNRFSRPNSGMLSSHPHSTRDSTRTGPTLPSMPLSASSTGGFSADSTSTRASPSGSGASDAPTAATTPTALPGGGSAALMSLWPLDQSGQPGAGSNPVHDLSSLTRLLMHTNSSTNILSLFTPEPAVADPTTPHSLPTGPESMTMTVDPSLLNHHHRDRGMDSTPIIGGGRSSTSRTLFADPDETGSVSTHDNSPALSAGKPPAPRPGQAPEQAREKDSVAYTAARGVSQPGTPNTGVTTPSPVPVPPTSKHRRAPSGSGAGSGSSMKARTERKGKSVGEDAPGSAPKASASAAASSAASAADQMTCTNCHTTKTPLWRRDPSGNALCNACGLFFKLHGVVRPLSLKSDVIRKRNRQSTVDKGRRKQSHTHAHAATTTTNTTTSATAASAPASAASAPGKK